MVLHLKHTTLPKNKFVLHSTFFLFNNKYYKQTFRAPMGSPLFPIIADLVLQQLEALIIYNLPVKFIFYFTYVDDIALAAPNYSLNNFMDRFNSFCGDQYDPTKLMTIQYATVHAAVYATVHTRQPSLL